MNVVTAVPLILGQYRRFGAAGPVYQVVSKAHVDASGSQWLNIVVLENGERAEYKLEDAVADPAAG